MIGRGHFLTLGMIQWTSILEVATSSCPRQYVDRTVQGTACTTRVQVRRRKNFLRRSYWLSEMDPLLKASNLLMLSALLA